MPAKLALKISAEANQHDDNYYSCGEALPHEIHSGEYEIAITKLSKLIKANPKCGCAFEHRAWCYHRVHENRKAWKDIKKCLQNPKHRMKSLGLAASILQELKRYKEAVKYCFEDLHTLQESFPEAKHFDGFYEFIGINLYLSGEVDKALEYLSKSLADREFPKRYYFRGLCYEKKKLYNEALKDFKRADQLLETKSSDDDISLYWKNQIALKRIEKKVN